MLADSIGEREPPCRNQIDQAGHFDAISSCDRQTDERADRHTSTTYTTLAQRWAVKIKLSCREICRGVVSVFTARRYVSAVYAMALCLSTSLSVTSRCSTKTAKLEIKHTTPLDSSGSLVFCCQKSPQNSTGVIPHGGAKCRWGGLKSATFAK